MESTQGLSRSEVTSHDGYNSMRSVRHLITPYYRLANNHCLTRAPKHAEELHLTQKASNGSNRYHCTKLQTAPYKCA